MAETVIRANPALPVAGVVTLLYTAVKAIEVLTVVACNNGPAASDVRVTRALAGAADDPGQNVINLALAEQLPPNVTQEIVVGLTATTGDILRCVSSTGTVAFHVSGLGR